VRSREKSRKRTLLKETVSGGARPIPGGVEDFSRGLFKFRMTRGPGNQLPRKIVVRVHQEWDFTEPSSGRGVKKMGEEGVQTNNENSHQAPSERG